MERKGCEDDGENMSERMGRATNEGWGREDVARKMEITGTSCLLETSSSNHLISRA